MMGVSYDITVTYAVRHWCRQISTDWETNTYGRFPTGINKGLCSSVITLYSEVSGMKTGDLVYINAGD